MGSYQRLIRRRFVANSKPHSARRVRRREAAANAEAQLPPEQPKAAEGTPSAAALGAVNCSELSGIPRAEHDNKHAKYANTDPDQIRDSGLDGIDEPEPKQRDADIYSSISCINAPSRLWMQRQQPNEKRQAKGRRKQ